MKNPTSLSSCWLWCLLLILPDSLQSQSTDYTAYYELTIQAREQYDEGEFGQAVKLLDGAFHLVKVPPYRDLKKAIEASMKANDTTSAIRYCQRIARLYSIVSVPSFIEDTIFFGRIIGSMIEVMDSARAGWDQQYIAIIDSMHAADQALRQYHPVVYADGINSDSLRMLRLLQLIHARGFPAAHRVGMKAYNQAQMIFLHADFDINNELLGDLMLSYVMRGEMDPRDYASIIDRRCNFRGETMHLYSAPFGYDTLPPSEKAAITSRRRSIGLRSVEDSMVVEILENGDLRTSWKY